MAKKKQSNPAYIKHQHKIMILIGIVIILLSYGYTSHIGVIFGALIVGIGWARVKDIQ